MQTNFFGTQADISQLWRWILEIPGVAVCEESSRPDQENRWFHSWEELEAAPDAVRQTLAAWSPVFGGTPVARRIVFEPDTQRRTNATGRTVLHSPAFIHVRQNNEQNGCLAAAYISCWTEKGARQRSVLPDPLLDSVDWKKFTATVGSLVRRLKKASPAKMRSCPIMPDAWANLQEGKIKLWNWGTECAYPSELITQRVH